MSLAGIIVVIGKGVIQQIGSPQDVYRYPANLFVATFIGQSNLLPARRTGERQLTLFGQTMTRQDLPVTLPIGAAFTLSLRPEELLPRGAEAGEPALTADIEFIRDMGGSLELRLNCAGMPVIATVAAAPWRHLRVGEAIPLTFAATAGVISHEGEHDDAPAPTAV
ncbi:MAG: TOBE domain-containing protein [Sodalis sp. (in: enterobacteria)]|uniref:TOBE domain-containing protein n=1 Tax=Sodalis sp. (in: enterobacteria) TaxID=1898979 RepID=UPI0039E303C4